MKNNIPTLEEMIQKLQELIPLSQKLAPHQQHIIALKIYEFEMYLHHCTYEEEARTEAPEEDLNPEQIMMSRTAEA